MRRLVQRIIAYGLLSLLLILMFRSMLNNLLFYPDLGMPDEAPASYHLTVEDHFVVGGDGITAHGWLTRTENARGTLLFFHGNAGNISHRLDNVAQLKRLGVNIYQAEYRGYGKSKGKPTEDALYADAVAAFDYLIKLEGIDPSRIVLFGRSLGSAVATYLSAKRDVAGVILESPMTNAADVAKTILPIPGIGRILPYSLDSLSRIKKVNAPLMIVHGKRDTVIPFRLGEKLFAEANEPKRFYPIERADHNDTYIIGGRAYWETFDSFLSDTLGAQNESDANE